MTLLVLLAFAIAVSGLLSYLAWRFTEGWLTLARLIPATFPMAFLIAPGIVGGENFAFFAPVCFVLLDSVRTKNWMEFYGGAVEPLLLVWGGVYILSVLVTALFYLVSRCMVRRAA